MTFPDSMYQAKDQQLDINMYFTCKLCNVCLYLLPNTLHSQQFEVYVKECT